MAKASETLKDQARVAAARFEESKKTWDAAERLFIRNVDVYLWRNRFKLMSSAAKAFMAIQNVPDNMGPTIERWRKMSAKADTA